MCANLLIHSAKQPCRHAGTGANHHMRPIVPCFMLFHATTCHIDDLADAGWYYDVGKPLNAIAVDLEAKLVKYIETLASQS